MMSEILNVLWPSEKSGAIKPSQENQTGHFGKGQTLHEMTNTSLEACFYTVSRLLFDPLATLNPLLLLGLFNIDWFCSL